MRPITYLLVLSAVLSVCAFAAAPAIDPDKPVALIFKPIGTVDFFKDGKDWAKAVPSTPLMSGDRVRTGENSFVVINARCGLWPPSRRANLPMTGEN